MTERGEVVFDFLEGSQNGLAVSGDGFVVGGDSAFLLGGACAAVKEVQGQRRADGPEAMRDGEQVGKAGILVAPRTTEAQRREEGSLGDADLGVGSSHAPFGSGNVRAAFEQAGR